MSKDNGNLVVEVARLHKLCGDSKVKAFADIKINDSILIKGLTVVEGTRGLFISMPREKGNNNIWYDAVRPLNKQVRAEIQAVVLAAYNS